MADRMFVQTEEHKKKKMRMRGKLTSPFEINFILSINHLIIAVFLNLIIQFDSCFDL